VATANDDYGDDYGAHCYDSDYEDCDDLKKKRWCQLFFS
jgi:hypothetical protein